MLKNKKLIKRRILWGDKQVCALALFALIVCGCATPAYKDVFKDKPAYNSKSFAVNRDILYQATLRAICARNFIIEKDDQEKGFILAKRSFQRGRKTIILALQANASFDEAQKTTLYLNALETSERYFVADRTRFLLWLIPLPGGGGKEGSSVKEGERVIEDKTFYENFFVEIDEEARRLSKVEASRKQEKEISTPVQTLEIEKSVIQEIPQEVILPEVVVPKVAPAETVNNETIPQEAAPQEAVREEPPFKEDIVREIPALGEALPAEKNAANSSQ